MPGLQKRRFLKCDLFWYPLKEVLYDLPSGLSRATRFEAGNRFHFSFKNKIKQESLYTKICQQLMTQLMSQSFIYKLTNNIQFVLY